jgi:hypothetical protein
MESPGTLNDSMTIQYRFNIDGKKENSYINLGQPLENPSRGLGIPWRALGENLRQN